MVDNDHTSNSNSSNPEDEPSPLLLLLQRPALVVILGLQLGLAFVYWNRKMDHAAVAKDLDIIQDRGHAWRFLSGALAHFELWHLGLNMAALYNLSMSLEGVTVSSLEYLGMNMSLIALVGAVWFALQQYHYQHHHRFLWQTTTTTTLAPEQQQQRRNPTVGYSGVLFALSVISTLNLPPYMQTCPVPFLDNFCLSTTQIWGGSLSFSWAPFIQLVMAQALLPRVSFTGHLAGVIVGFAYSWGLLPFLAFPSIYWSLLHMTFLKYIRRIDDRTKQQHHNLRYYRSVPFLLQAGALVASMVFAGGLMGPMNVSFAVWIAFDWYVELSEHHESVVRGYAVASVLHMIAVAITITTRAAILLGPPAGHAATADLFQWAQWLLCMAGISRNLPFLGEQQPSGIFELVLGHMFFPLSSSEYRMHMPRCLRMNCGNVELLPQTTTTLTSLARGGAAAASSSPFPGSGRTLGGGSGQRGTSGRLSHLV